MKKQETTPKTREELFAEKTDKCPLYRDDQPVRMPLGIAKIYYDMPQRIAHSLKQHLIDHFNRKRYYEYHSGYRPVPPDHEQYIRQAIVRFGWTAPVELKRNWRQFFVS